MILRKNSGKIIRLFDISPVKDQKSRACIRSTLEKAIGQSEKCVPVYGYQTAPVHGRQMVLNYAVGCFEETKEVVIVPINTRKNFEAEILLCSSQTVTALDQIGLNAWRICTVYSLTPLLLTVPAYVPDIGEIHGQMPIDQAGAAAVFQAIMESLR